MTPGFGPWLRLRRRALDVTQADLARAIGYSEETIRKVEAGRLRPSKTLTESLAAYLGLPAEDRGDFLRFARQGRPNQAAIATVPGALPLVAPSSDGDLPVPPTRLIGRQADLAQLGNL